MRVVAGGRYTVAAWTADIARERGGWVEVAPAVGAAVVLDSARQAWRPLVVGGELSFVPPDVAGGRPLFRVALAAQDARFGDARLYVPSVAAGWRWGGAVYGGPTLAVGTGIVDDEGNAWVPQLEGGGEVGVHGRYVWTSVAAGGALGLVDDGAGAAGLAWPWATLRLGLRVVTGQR